MKGPHGFLYLYLCNLIFPAGKTGLEKEQEFIRKCMESLLMASANLDKDAQSSLTSIERGLLMLKTHLEAFRRRSEIQNCIPDKYGACIERNFYSVNYRVDQMKMFLSGLRIICDSGRLKAQELAATWKLWVTSSRCPSGLCVSPPASLTRYDLCFCFFSTITY